MNQFNISEDFIKKFGKKFPPEAFLMREGDQGNTLFIISTGKIAIIKNTPVGEKILAVLGPGNFFGEMAIMGLQDKRAASAKTVAETTVLELNKEAFEALIKRSPEIAFNVIRTLTERVRDANGKISALINRDDRVRVFNYLNHLTVDKGVDAPDKQPGRCTVAKPKDIATALAMEPEKVMGYMNLARKARIMGQNGDWIWVPYPQYLVPFGEYLVVAKVQ
jgi:CRP/FNR family cyclic AMP-dependent transcriptional regulator